MDGCVDGGTIVVCGSQTHGMDAHTCPSSAAALHPLPLEGAVLEDEEPDEKHGGVGEGEGIQGFFDVGAYV